MLGFCLSLSSAEQSWRSGEESKKLNRFSCLPVAVCTWREDQTAKEEEEEAEGRNHVEEVAQRGMELSAFALCVGDAAAAASSSSHYRHQGDRRVVTQTLETFVSSKTRLAAKMDNRFFQNVWEIFTLIDDCLVFSLPRARRAAFASSDARPSGDLDGLNRHLLLLLLLLPRLHVRSRIAPSFFF